MKLPILFEDAYLLIIDKPAGLQTENDRHGNPSAEGRVGEYLRKKYPLKKRLLAGVVHRLDRPVSGVLIFTKTPMALKVMNEQFADRTVRKSYLALTDSAPAKKKGELIHYLLKDMAARRSVISTKGKKGAKFAKLRYRFHAKAAGRNLLEILLFTGRYHQIRAQLSEMGCPIVGDEKYGSEMVLPEGQIALRSHSIEFDHPKTGERMKVEAPMPTADFWG